MQPLTRRQLLQVSALAGAGLSLAACRPVRRPEELGQVTPVPAASDQFAAVDKEAQDVLTTYNVPGMAYGLIRGNELVHANGFGVRNLDTGAPMTPQSVMSMGSVSKAFTAAAVMQLAEEGKLDVDAPYTTSVPYFEMEDPRYKEIAVRHLLAHRSGMPELTPDDLFGEWEDPWYDEGAAERYVRSFKTGVTLNQDPGGDKFLYSDAGYDILADLIHKGSGELFEDYMQQHILAPLGMGSSTFLLDEIDPDQLVAAHVFDEAGRPVVWEKFPYDRKHAPSSCLHTSVEDLSRWALAQMNGGELNGQRILQPQSQAQLWESLTAVQDNPFFTDYGWGWWLGEFEGTQNATSTGAQPGVDVITVLLPQEGLGIIAMGNAYGSLAGAETPYYLVDFVLNTLGKLLHGEI